MTVVKLPPSVVKVLDALRWAFLWNAAERASGVQCLVARDLVCWFKVKGGLAVRDLSTQNDSLLLKMLHCLHSAAPSRWAAWVWAELDGCSLLLMGAPSLAAEHWCYLWSLLPTYHTLTRVDVGDGKKTFVWNDSQLSCGLVRCAFPVMALHTPSP